MILARGAIAVAAVVLIASANLAAAEGTDLYAPRPADQVRQELLKWLSRHDVTNEKTVSSILQLWAAKQHAGAAAAGLRAADSEF